MRGVYLLTIHLQRPAKLKVGHLGTFEFPEGYYLYVGSAMSGFAGRINRHLRRRKRMRWHVDYLLAVAEPLWVDLYETQHREDECRLNAKVAKLPGASVASPRFGASDCKCRTHLHHFKTLPEMRPVL